MNDECDISSMLEAQKSLRSAGEHVDPPGVLMSCHAFKRELLSMQRHDR